MKITKRISTANYMKGDILLSSCTGDLDDIADGTYGKVLSTAIRAGKILLTSEGVSGSLPTSLSDAKCTDPNADQTSANPQSVAWLTDAGALALKDAVDLATAEVTNKVLDNIADGATYSRVLTTDVTAGHILLSEALGSLDDIADGTYGKVLSTAISAGNILLSSCTGDLDDIADGTYGKVLSTAISAGKIVLTGGGGVDGVLPVGNTEAKCTNALADQTSANPQDYTWITGSKPPSNADHTADIVSAMAYEDLVEKSKLGTTIMSGGYIRADMLDVGVAYISQGAMIANAVIGNAHIIDLSADKINAGTLTGRTVQSAASGQYVRLDAATHRLVLGSLPGGSATVVEMYAGDGKFGVIDVTHLTDATYLELGNHLGGFTLHVEGDLQVGDAFDVYPKTDNGVDLGRSSQRFYDLFLARNLSDGTNSLTVANAKTAYDHSQITTGNPHSLSLTDLSDISIASPANVELLTYHSGTSAWINRTAAEAGLSTTGHSHTAADISDVDPFSQSGTYGSLRAQATTKGDVGLGNVPNTNIAYSTAIAADDFTQTEVNNLRAAKLEEGKAPWTTNSNNLTNHLKDAANPHGVTKAQD